MQVILINDRLPSQRTVANAKCKMQNDCIRFADDFLMIAAGDTTIMHYAL